MFGRFRSVAGITPEHVRAPVSRKLRGFCKGCGRLGRSLGVREVGSQPDASVGLVLRLLPGSC